MPDVFNILDQSLAYLQAQAMAVGEATVPRDLAVTSGISMSSQSLRVAYFTAQKSETISQVRMHSTGTAAGATPSLVRVGIWTADSTGALLSLVAATANDTTLLASTNTAYTKALSASFTKQAGQRYGVGLLVVTAAAAPTVGGLAPTGLNGTEATTVLPAISALVSGQSDLPASVAAGGLTASTNRPYIALLP